MSKAKKFGAFGGVFTPSILTILGVIMYLRLPWIVGQAGLWATLGIIFVSHIISASTGLSVASIATDKKVESGGTYFIISRSLGLPIGGTLGWALFVGLSFSVSLYLIGFAEVFLGYFGFDVTLNNIRIAGVIILLVVTILTFISTSLAIKTQYLILTAMVLSLISVFMGSHSFAPAELQTGVLPDSLPWIALFAIFFPAVTGFEAGVSMSGDLRDPKTAIPRGTIGAILVGLVTYVGLALYFSFTVDRNVLVNDTNVLFKISWLPQLVIAGILGATFSSALGSILSAPRILQAIAKDHIAPRFFSKGQGASNEPRNAILLTFVIALGGILIGELNVIARVVTTFFIITYGFLNITYTIESWASSDFRPSFRIPRFVSIIGAIASIVIMIQLDILAMIAATVILLGLFLVLRRKELNLQSGDTWNSVWMSIVKHGLRKLTKNEINNRNWRPNVILMSGGATARPHLIAMGEALVGHQGVFTNFELEESEETLTEGVISERVRVEKRRNKSEIITRKYRCASIYEGIDMISRVYGFSGFEPDTILMGWPKATANPQRMNQLLRTLQLRDFNLALLDYHTEKGFGTHSSVDFWWTGSGRELTFALHLMRFISANKEWRKVKLRVLAINADSTLTERYYSLLRQMVENYRLNAEVKVVMKIDQSTDEDLIATTSASTSLVLLSLPDMTEDNSVELIHQTDSLSTRLHSCLWLKASGRFELVDILPDDYRSSFSALEEASSNSLCASLDVSAADRDAPDLMEFAQKAEQELVKLHNELFVVLERRRIAVVDALLITSVNPEQRKHLIAGKVEEELSFEQELLQHMLSVFLKNIEANVVTLLKQLHLKPGRKDGKVMEIAVRYYLFARRVDSVELFYNQLLFKSTQYTTQVRDVLSRMYVADDDGNATVPTQIVRIKQIHELVRFHFSELYARMVEDMRQDILLLSQMLEGAKLNEMYPAFKKLIQQKQSKLIFLDEVPLKLHRFEYLQWNKTLLDVYCQGMKEDINQKVQLLIAELHQVIGDSLYQRLTQLRSELSAPATPELTFSAHIPELPSLEFFFVQLAREIHEKVEELPELLTVSDNQLPEYLSVENVDELKEYEIKVRTTIGYYISNDLVFQLNQQAGVFSKGVTRVSVATGNIRKLSTYHRSQYPKYNNDSRIFEELKQNTEKEISRLELLEQQLTVYLRESIEKAFSTLTAVEIINEASSPGAGLLPHRDRHRIRRTLPVWWSKSSQAVVRGFVALFYHQSKGVLWTKRQELDTEKAVLYPGDMLKKYAEMFSPKKDVLSQLPYYYVSLFTDDAGAAREFRVEMKEETDRGNKAVHHFRAGNPGLLIITGDPGSGKSSLARYLVESNFEKSQQWKIRPPLECIADLKYFEDQLKEYAGRKGSLERRLDVLQGQYVVVMDDLEVWWERRPGGTQVIERMLEIVKMYGSQLLFVVTVNRHALHVLEQLTRLNSWVNELIYCQPFDAMELKKMILTRHQAGGLSFVMQGQEEEDVSNWTYAKYFNHLFNCTDGNPGKAVQLWLSGIKSVNGTEIRIEKPASDQLVFDGHLTENELLVLLQFVMHRRFTVQRLALILCCEPAILLVSIRQLLRNGVLIEIVADNYALQPSMELAIIKHLKAKSFL